MRSPSPIRQTNVSKKSNNLPKYSQSKTNFYDLNEDIISILHKHSDPYSSSSLYNVNKTNRSKTIYRKISLADLIKYANLNVIDNETFTTTQLNNVAMFAVQFGRLDIMKMLIRRGFPFNLLIYTEIAAENGHLEVLEYLHENGCPWDKWTCNCAAKNGHLQAEIPKGFPRSLCELSYLHSNGCPWNEDNYKLAVKNGWLNSNSL